ncbi:hypothetical protein B0T18DRAFT_331680 [Schizothecium vesticola]|uniref:Uncharacterized protein n=1 Tax=Schizothecium vesticola TaxID=314040 RepID=A0AA40K0K2_9PEZI|nr:hypothetical protein B0T18DRAFT_331680 [Schizothecium vesticola]
MSTPKHHLLATATTWTLALASLAGAHQHTPPRSGICTWIPEGPLRATEWDALHARACALPLVDDTSSDWAPWSYKPACAHPKDKEGGSKYCVYTHNATRGTRGLSVLATPEIAAGVVGYLRDVDPKWLHPQGREYHVSLGEEGGAYEVKEVEGKGRGAVATRRIRAGEVLVRETPAVMNMVTLPRGVAPGQVGEMWEVAVGRLGVRERGEVLGMARGAGGEGAEVVDGIMNTNGFGVEVGGERLTVLAPAVAVCLLSGGGDVQKGSVLTLGRGLTIRVGQSE